MDIVLLKEDDAEDVERLASHHYPSNYPMPLEDIRENLGKADRNSFYFGVEEKGELVGYLMAWLDNTMVEGRQEKVLLVDDIVLSNRARSHLFRLLQSMITDMQKRGFGKLPIEGSTRPSSGHTFMGHPEALERLGYELTSLSEYYEEEFEETLTWVRFEPIAENAATIDVDDLLEIEFEKEV